MTGSGGCAGCATALLLSVGQTSVIEGPPFVRSGLAGLGEALAQLFTQLSHGDLVVQAPLDLDAKPQGFGVRQVAVVQAPDVELRTVEITALKQQMAALQSQLRQ